LAILFEKSEKERYKLYRNVISDLTKKDEYSKNESTKGYENESNLLVSQRETKASLKSKI